jgi:hypothetical protein
MEKLYSFLYLFDLHMAGDRTAFCIVDYSCVVFIAFLEVLFTCSL